MIAFDRRSALRGILQSVAAVLLAVIVIGGALALGGKNPVTILSALVRGPFSNRYRFAEALARSCPLMLCGLAVAIAFRSQAWNIGVEGQYLLGAIAATAIGLWGARLPGAALIPVMLLAAAAAGALFALPAVLLENLRRVPLVLSTILLNFVGVSLVSYLTQGPLRGSDPSAAQTDPIASQAYLRILLRSTDWHIGWWLALALCFAAWVMLRWSVWGFEVRVCGLNPVAAEWAGIRVPRVRTGVMMLSGGIGGLAGGIQVAGVTHLLSIQASEGFGYVAVAVALLGRLNPLGVAVAAVFLGAIDVGASQVERQADLGVSADIAQVIKGLIVLIVLVMTSPLWQRWLDSRKIARRSAAFIREPAV